MRVKKESEGGERGGGRLEWEVRREKEGRSDWLCSG